MSIDAAQNDSGRVRTSAARRRELKLRDNELASYGVALSDIRHSKVEHRFFLCLVRGLLIFFACFGLVGGLVSSFGLPFSLPAVALGILALSLITAFIYYNKLSFYLGYFLVFAGFLYLSIRYYWYVNSGYQAFMNELFNAYSDYFRLLSTREATEFIENRYLSVSIAMIFMGWFFCILLNITISGYMDLFTTFLITFLPLQLAFYIDIVPPLPYLCMLIAVYISVALLKRSGRFTLPYRAESQRDFSRVRKKKRQKHEYYSSSKGMLQVFGYSVGISAVFLLVSSALFAGDFDGRYVSNSVKDTTDRYVKNIVQGGIYSLFNRYQATGGLARGQLGGIGNVSPDFGTDLILRLVPNNSSNIYLKAFCGAHYENSRFLEDAATPGDPTLSLHADELTEADAYLPQLSSSHDVSGDSLYDNENYISKMWVSNVDADHSYAYHPYYTLDSTSRFALDASGRKQLGLSSERIQKARESFPEAQALFDDAATIDSYGSDAAYDNYELLYLPYDVLLYYNPNPDVSAEYQELVYRTYLQIPDSLDDVLDKFCTEAGLYTAAESYPSLAAHEERPLHPQTEAQLSRYKELEAQRLGIAAQLRLYFARTFEYTMSPGTTPRNTDVVEYFLNTQKRGYCAHFASSATLLLRHMGIPARYVEGYLCTINDIMDGRALTNSAEGWQSNAASLDGSGVVEVELSDGAAHAWVEIWLDGYGWIPYEMTPPSSEDPAVNLDLFSLFGGLFNSTMRSAAPSNSTNAPNTNLTNTSRLGRNLSGYSFILRPLAILFSALLLFLLSFPLIRRLREELSLIRVCRQGHYSEALLIHYRRLVRKMIRIRRLPQNHPTLRDVQTALDAYPQASSLLSPAQSEQLFSLLRSSAYAPGTIDKPSYSRARQLIKAISRKIKKGKKKPEQNAPA